MPESQAETGLIILLHKRKAKVIYKAANLYPHTRVSIAWTPSFTPRCRPNEKSALSRFWYVGRVIHYPLVLNGAQREKSPIFDPDSPISDVGTSSNKPNDRIGNAWQRDKRDSSYQSHSVKGFPLSRSPVASVWQPWQGTARLGSLQRWTFTPMRPKNLKRANLKDSNLYSDKCQINSCTRARIVLVQFLFLKKLHFITSWYSLKPA